MRAAVVAFVVVGCSQSADIGNNNNTQPITCQPAASGQASGTVTNPTTRASFTFGTVTKVTLDVFDTVRLDDSSLTLVVGFPCSPIAIATLGVASATAACPKATSEVAGDQAQINIQGAAGTVIVDHTVGCLAGRYDITFGDAANLGEAVGWFSIPRP
jgi:hypothetical protein